MDRPMYQECHIVFLKKQYPLLSLSDLTIAFNDEFGLGRAESQIRSVLNNRSITCGRKPGGLKKGKSTLFTDEQSMFIRKGYKSMTLPVLTVALNSKFDSDFKESQLRSFTKNHKVRSGRTGNFEPGHKSWNAGTAGQGLTKANSGSFKKGGVPINITPIGTERVNAYGYIEIKIDEPDPYTKALTRYKLKHIVLWVQAHGPVPEGMVVTFIDSDKTNCCIENLEIISRQELHCRNQLGYGKVPNELKPTVSMLSKLQVKRFSLCKKTVDTASQGNK